MNASLLRRKPLQPETDGERRLARTLGWPHLVALGVGAIVGTGILTLIGVGAGKAGPAVILSFVIAGAICACAALAYAEMATMIPVSGGAYTYSYVVLGELPAWIIGWSLILEYSLVVSAVAVGWSGYAAPLLSRVFGIPMALMQGPEAGGIVNLPAVAIIVLVAGLLLRGTRESATVNALLVLVKIAALVVFVAFALPTVILAFFYGQSRIFFTMARDGMLPQGLAALSSRGSPVRITLFTAALVIGLAGFVPLGQLAALANAGTLAAFIAVAACMLVMRRRAPDAPRTFRAPAPWLIGPIAILGCLYLFFSLPTLTQSWFVIWNGLGVVFYVLYGRRRAVIAKR